MFNHKCKYIEHNNNNNNNNNNIIIIIIINKKHEPKDQRVVEKNKLHWMSVKAGISLSLSHWRPPMMGRAMNSARKGERMKKRKMRERRVTHEMPQMLINMIRNTNANLIANASLFVKSFCNVPKETKQN